MRAALYLRVSTDEQSTENQRIALTAEAERKGWTIVKEYEDAGISGAKGRDKRPGLDAMLKDARRRRYDVVMCWALDRLGRSLADLIGALQELEHNDVALYLRQQEIDTTQPAGKLFFHLLGAFAEFERSMIVQRVRAGIARARARGKHLGRPGIGHEKDPAKRKERRAIVEAVERDLKAGVSITQIARTHSVGIPVVYKIKASIAAVQ